MAKKRIPLPALDPLAVPSDWHRYLYCAILLRWETSAHQLSSFPRFDANTPIAGVTLRKRKNATEVQREWEQRSGDDVESTLTFHGKDAALKSLMRNLRNCAAHGHYSQVDDRRIQFRHTYRGKMNLFGTLLFSELKALVAFILEEEKASTTKR